MEEERSIFIETIKKDKNESISIKVIPVKSLGTHRFYAMPFHRPITKLFKTTKFDEK